MISLVKLYNFISIYRNLFIISLFIYSSAILTLSSYIELGSLDNNFLFLSKMALEKLSYIKNNSFLIFSIIVILLVSFIFIFSIVIMFFSKVRKYEIPINKKIKIINSFNLSKKYKFYFHRNKTFASLNTLYISFNDFLNINEISSKFKILHEICHIKSYDSIINLFEKSLQIIFSIFISGFISGKGEELIRKYQFLNSDIIPLYIPISFSLIFIVVLYINFFPTRFKEYICDMYALRKINIKIPPQPLYKEENKLLIKLQHPSFYQRKQFLLGNNYKEKLFLYIYEISCLILLIFLYIILSIKVIIYPLLFLVLLDIIFLLKVSKI